MRDTSNIYYRARLAAAQENPVFSSRERTAGAIYVSQEALYDYETGRTVPPCDVVQKMIEAYGAYELKREHICANCPLITDYNPQPSLLTQAALGWITALGGASEVGMAFAQVARDGRISLEERKAAQGIRNKAVDIMRVMQETITAIDKGLSGGVGSCGSK